MKNEDDVKFIKSKRLAWMSYTLRKDENRIPRQIMEWKPAGRRKRGRPMKRWVDNIKKDIPSYGSKRLVLEREEWWKIVF